VLAIESLMNRRGSFDYILLETTGLADPGNIAPLFWVDDGLGSSIYLDGIVTLVDTKNVLRLLEEPAPQEIQETRDNAVLTTAHLQISHADVILLNKSDLVSAEELEAVKERIVSINSLANLHVTDHSKIPRLEGTVLDLHAYDKLTTVDFQEKGQSKLDPVRASLQTSVGGRSLTPRSLFRPFRSHSPISLRKRYPLSIVGCVLYYGTVISRSHRNRVPRPVSQISKSIDLRA
jgi:G3E family GTPase